jgi:hypothetical protein
MECRITVKGHLDRAWSDWLDGLAICEQPDGTTILVGELPDQAALHGVLCTMRNLGVPLVALTCRDQSDTASGRL